VPLPEKESETRNGGVGRSRRPLVPASKSAGPLWRELIAHSATQGSVAKSTFAGLPWLLYLRKKCRRPLHFWPFEGWEVPEDKSVVAEVYPSLWTRRFPKEGRDGGEQAAFAAAAWLQRADLSGSLGSYFNPPLTPEEREVAAIEKWILGVI
jgi:hypothetical protein